MTIEHSFKNKRIILTGATGGIGSQLASQLSHAGAKLCLVGQHEAALEQQARSLNPERTIAAVADLTQASGRAHVLETCLNTFQGIDILINNAGINAFESFMTQRPEDIQNMININLTAPMLLTQAVLPEMRIRNVGQIVNIGSTFGTIGFAWFAAYSASKFGLRGFSQALRRELAETDIAVTYIAPRAVKTAMNSDAVNQMAAATKMNMDEPDWVATKILDAMLKQKKESYLGFPENLFVKINAILPSLVDNSLRKQNQKAKKFVVKKTLDHARE